MSSPDLRPSRFDAAHLQPTPPSEEDDGAASSGVTEPPEGYDADAPTIEGGAELVVEQKLALVRVRAVFVNEEDWQGPLTYKFSARRKGRSGTAEVQRSGTFSLSSGEGTVLTTLPISVQSSDRLLLHIAVFAGATLVGEDRVRHHVPP